MNNTRTEMNVEKKGIKNERMTDWRENKSEEKKRKKTSEKKVDKKFE